jgi:subtilisin family serine protease
VEQEASAQVEAAQYLVLYPDGASSAEGRAAVQAAGGAVVEENAQIGLAVVNSSSPAFVSRATAASSGLVGAARNRPVGEARPTSALDRERAELAAAQVSAEAEASTASDSAQEPLAALQWDMKMIGATPEGSYKRTLGRSGVLVGVIDTGIDGSHPDLAPNFDAERSRNFTTDIPLIDGPCVDEADASCNDPADVDEDGHGTHVAGTIAAAYNGFGISGIAPKVTLVNLRAGQDSGYFFLKATVDALTYAGDIGVDVVNMSFYVDPWLYNCPANAADSPAEQLEQRTIVAAVQRAIDYARARGVTPISALGNERTDLGSPTVDETSPDFPPGTEKSRMVDNSCLDVPAELDGVISASAVGPSRRKADYSNYGIEQTDVAAPGGWFRDGFGTPSFQTFANTILSTTPESVARDNGSVAPDGTPTTPQVVRSCDSGGRCAYYRYEQGTSMAAPHVVGVAALIVSKYGEEDPLDDDGRTMSPDLVEKVLLQTAKDTPCPLSGVETYAAEGRDPSFDAPCVGNARLNGIYGEGIVDALAAVTKGEPLVDDGD